MKTTTGCTHHHSSVPYADMLDTAAAVADDHLQHGADWSDVAELVSYTYCIDVGDMIARMEMQGIDASITADN